tara:strand:+ start:596 stop:1528 length:933 start_codon:yes stop_codon:yes gene_type:complete
MKYYNNNRIITIGDLHGDYLIFKKVLRMCKLINDKEEWIGKNTYLIQIGDTLDGKRPGVNNNHFLNESGELEIFNLILKLDIQAKKNNGRVISILGNHELYPFYLGNDQNFIKEYVKSKDIETIKKIEKMNRSKFFQPGNKGGIILGKTRPLILQLGEFLFIHGSITDKLIYSNLNSKNKVNIQNINNEVSNWLQNPKKNVIPEYLKNMDENNPLFSRDYSKNEKINISDCEKIRKQLSFFEGAKYIVMGHSRFNDINVTCEKMLIRTDVSLSRAFGGGINKKIQALEIIQGRNKNPELYIISESGKIKL